MCVCVCVCVRVCVCVKERQTPFPVQRHWDILGVFVVDRIRVVLIYDRNELLLYIVLFSEMIRS